jgi:hypothetical protein
MRSAHTGDRQQDADYAAESRWRSQPAIMKSAGKLYPPAIQSSASVQTGRGSNRGWMKPQWQVKARRPNIRSILRKEKLIRKAR